MLVRFGSSSLTANKRAVVRLLSPFSKRDKSSLELYPTCTFYESKIDVNVLINGFVYNDEEQILSKEEFFNLLPPEDKAILQQCPENEVSSRRLGRFLVKPDSRKRFTFRMGSKNIKMGKKSADNGNLIKNHVIPQYELELAMDGEMIRYEAEKAGDVYKGASIFVPKTGISIISNIDDTIMNSHAYDRENFLVKMFSEEFEPVPDMASLYQSWKKELYNASFHYISSASWRLCKEYESFMEQNGFPFGCFAMKYERFNAERKELLNLFDETNAHQLQRIASIIEKYPSRGFVLVGNTGGHAPELYGTIYRRYPKRVKKIVIRNVNSSMSGKVVKALNEREAKKMYGIRVDDPGRLGNAFYGVPDEKIAVLPNISKVKV